MVKNEIKALEVLSNNPGWYYVTLFQYNKESEEDPDYFQDWLEFTSRGWDYGLYKDSCYVCFIHKKKEPIND